MKRTFTNEWVCDKCSYWIGRYYEKPTHCWRCDSKTGIREATEGELK
jgi:hypothetical protein